MNYVADFETTTDANDCRVWAYGICEVGNLGNITVGNSIDEFMDKIFKLTGDTIWFHNLKFDGEFIISWLLTHGWHYNEVRKKMKEFEFTTLISDMGQFYSMTIKTPDGMINIQDSLKVFPMSVDAIAKSFKLEIGKLEIDYHKKREAGHKITDLEREYIENDVKIVAEALHIQFMAGLKKMTQGSNALADYKERVGGVKRFQRNYPELEYEYDQDIRRAYRGGFVYANPKYQGKVVESGIVLDVNSLYPDRMKKCVLPYGVPIKFEGRYKYDEIYNLYVQCIKCNLKLKPRHLPCISVKYMRYSSSEYVVDTNGEEITLYLTNVDLNLMMEQYDVTNLEYLGGYKFKGAQGLFDDYIGYWIGQKEKATIEGNAGQRTLSKLMLNALYGKFGLNPNVRSKHPYLDKGVVKYYAGKAERRKPIYIPMAVFITSEARNKTIRAGQRLYDRFLYSDTDSLHLQGTEIPVDIEVDNVKLGAWKHESTFTQAKFLRAKTYIEMIDGEVHITCAGMPKDCYSQVTLNNFNTGQRYSGKRLPKHVVGGIVLEDKEFTIR